MNRLVLVRHAHARSNVAACVSSLPPGEGLSELGLEEALALREAIAHEPVGLGVASRLARTQETLDLALGGREVPRLVLPGLDEIGFGSFEAGALAEYRTWAFANEPDALCPGGGESRAHAAERFAGALDTLLAREEDVVLAVSHSLPIRYVLDAADGAFPAAQIVHVAHATPHELDAAAVERAAETLRAWAAAPRFAERRF
ncbi:MAG: histidine phosphatase family protein [Actinobacteria bacterium]|nr:histidine phosphatase family protein [Actinomycetota bacterium]